MKVGAQRLFNRPVYILLHTSIAQKMNNTKYSLYIQVHMVFSKGSILLKLSGIKMKKNTPVDSENKQVFGFRKPTTEIMKNKLTNFKFCLRCSSPKCPSSIMCFSVWYYDTSKLSNFDFTSEKFKHISYNPINIHISAPDSSSLNTQNFTSMTMIPNYKTQT